MKTTLLQCEGLIALECAAGSELICISGLLWVTQDQSDLIVHPGERCRLHGGGKTLIQAMRTSHFEIVTAQRWWQRMATAIVGPAAASKPATTATAPRTLPAAVCCQATTTVGS
ncbi:DUF2917 domain-containing protein [Chitiniphilus purpureus]|uniref:DUF2917 domain-containing protein n=1 Tax=Chitiniphilus purpureus TaxID=2981137 RepID=A0ABY6DQT8_9NEIS|nr:DUF2917 domain-containing protein [Chitiniphilus sp. CD1]UXY14278.1 DUF2917 domain-containing protein [Chitiniphilus sp. CD1]